MSMSFPTGLRLWSLEPGPTTSGRKLPAYFSSWSALGQRKGLILSHIGHAPARESRGANLAGTQDIGSL